MNFIRRSAVAVLGLSSGALAVVAVGQSTIPLVLPPLTPPAISKDNVPGPDPANLNRFVANKTAAIQLGKALFWDMQVGSDGMTACATCHFHAGADSRSINQVNPGKDAAFRFGPNYHLKAADFPLRKLVDPANRGSVAQYDFDDVVSSQGVFKTEFVSIIPGMPWESVTRPFDPLFSVGGLNVRRVEPRNTPSVINAVFNYRNFWDGRAQNEFNGVNNWGDRDPDARVYRASSSTAPLEPIRLAERPEYRLVNSSLASQAVAPIMSVDEMSAAGRDGADIGTKLARLSGKKLKFTRPLAMQVVHPQDSVLGSLSRSPYRGLNVDSYDALIRRAFHPEWWNSAHALKVDANGSVQVLMNTVPAAADEYTLMEYNFTLFFGLALQLYQATLVSDETKYDRWLRGKATITAQEFRGLEIFVSQDGAGKRGARCVNCHGGAEFTDASVANVMGGTVRRVRDSQDLDRGFNNIGVRPTTDDLGVGGLDKFGNPLSAVAACRMTPPKHTALCPTAISSPPAGFSLMAVEGAFKAPGLRNVELTAPYFHNGGHLTLASVIDFYSRGGDMEPLRTADGTLLISPLSIPSLDGVNRGFTQAEREALLAFMKTLTDERVRYHRAPFDHPQIFVPDGQRNDDMTALRDPLRPGQAMDRIREISAVGARGYSADRRPRNFLEGLTSSSGSRDDDD